MKHRKNKGLSTGKCKVAACSNAANSWMLMCGLHWELVPLPLRAAIARLRRKGVPVESPESKLSAAITVLAVHAVARAEGCMEYDAGMDAKMAGIYSGLTPAECAYIDLLYAKQLAKLPAFDASGNGEAL